MTTVKEMIMDDFQKFEAPGYGIFHQLGEGFDAIVLENSQDPTELRESLVQGLIENNETIVMIDGDLILPKQRVVLAIQRLSVTGEDMVATSWALTHLQEKLPNLVNL